jgi:hypothetical protein
VVFADDIHILDENINTTKKDTDAMLENSIEDCLELNTGKFKYVIVFGHQNAGPSHRLLTANKSFQTVPKFK